MCNCKGWDIAYYEDEIVPEPHFCRVYGDCGSVDNTLEDAAQFVAAAYNERYDQYCDMCNRDLYDFDDAKANHLLEQSRLWASLEHPSYLYYKSDIDFSDE